MTIVDPREKPVFRVRMAGHAGAGKTELARAILDVPLATDDELARLAVFDDGLALDAPAPEKVDAVVLVVRGAPGDDATERVASAGAGARAVLVAVHARDAREGDDEALREAWNEVVEPRFVYLTATPKDGPARGVDELRAALVQLALEGVDVTIERARKAKRPYATGIVAGAALVTAAEGLLPGAAAFVVATQVGAITSLYYLYTGRWMGRTQALALIPAFASEAAGGTAFLIVKSFLPPTGVADAVAAAIAASMTIAMLGAVTWALEHGYELDEKAQLQAAFRRLQAKTKAERSVITRNKHRWKDKGFWTDLVRRMLFE